MSGDAALVLALRMLFDLRTPNIPLRKALVEGLYRVFRAIIPPSMGAGVDTTDNAIFEHSAVCWMALLDKSKDCSSEVKFRSVIVMTAVPCSQQSLASFVHRVRNGTMRCRLRVHLNTVGSWTL